MTGDIATASIRVEATPDEVWEALTDPDRIKEYYFGTTVTTDWAVGSPITWAGEYEGKSYEDHGEILEVRRPRLLRHTHFSPLGGKPDAPANHHTLTYTLTEVGDATQVTLEQDNNDSAEAAEHSADNWRTMLEGLKAAVEKRGDAPSDRLPSTG